jgi:putative addiction module CopG family antidote
MSVALTPRSVEQIRRWIETGRYPNADAVAQTALRALEAEEDATYLKLRALVRAGFESGPAVELTDAPWHEIERSSEERFRRGEEPASHVYPLAPAHRQARAAGRHRRNSALRPRTLGSRPAPSLQHSTPPRDLLADGLL